MAADPETLGYLVTAVVYERAVEAKPLPRHVAFEMTDDHATMTVTFHVAETRGRLTMIDPHYEFVDASEPEGEE